MRRCQYSKWFFELGSLILLYEVWANLQHITKYIFIDIASNISQLWFSIFRHRIRPILRPRLAIRLKLRQKGTVTVTLCPYVKKKEISLSSHIKNKFLTPWGILFFIKKNTFKFISHVIITHLLLSESEKL